MLYVKSVATAPQGALAGYTLSKAASFSDVVLKSTKLQNSDIAKAYNSSNTGYRTINLTDSNSFTYTANAICNQHSKATSTYKYLQIKKGNDYYIQIPNVEAAIKKIVLTVSNTTKQMTDGGNTSKLYFSSDKTTKNAIANGSGESSITIDLTDNKLTTGYIVAEGAIRIWDIEIFY